MRFPTRPLEPPAVDLPRVRQPIRYTDAGYFRCSVECPKKRYGVPYQCNGTVYRTAAQRNTCRHHLEQIARLAGAA